jgi:xanthine dehydrogenase/oxidase
VNACLRPLASLDGMAVTTTEGIGSTRTELDTVQHRIAACNGSQCGFCTPGFVMTMYSFLQDNPGPTRREVEDAFDGNLCRCTGFRPILHAMKTFARDHDREEDRHTLDCTVDEAEKVPYASHPFHFPDALKEPPRPLFFHHDGYRWFRPVVLSDVYRIKGEHADERVRLVVGNTSIGVYKQEDAEIPVMVDVSHVPELLGCRETEAGLEVGAATSYADLITALEEAVEKNPPERTARLAALLELAKRTAGGQVRNAASVAGNLMMVVEHVERGVPFPSDLFTGLVATGATVAVGSATWPEPRELSPLELAAQYGSRRGLPRDFVVLALRLPWSDAGEVVQPYKVALRPQNSHSLVNACFRVRFGKGGVVQEAAAAYGGLLPIAFRVPRTEAALAGKRWNAETLDGAMRVLQAEVRDLVRKNRKRIEAQPWDGIPTEYRVSLVESLFYKYFVHAAAHVAPGEVPAADRSAGEVYVRPVSTGRQHFRVYRDEEPVSEPVLRLSAFLQAAGEAKYTQDLPLPARGCNAAFVIAERALCSFSYRDPATGKTADAAAAAQAARRTFPTFVGFVTAADFPAGGTNELGADDPVFVDGNATAYGQPIGLALADTLPVAERVAAFLQEWIAYDAQPPVLTIDQALAEGKKKEKGKGKKNGKGKGKDENPGLFPENAQHQLFTILRPGANPVWMAAEGRRLPGARVAEGRQRTGAQAHFYMETQAALALPGETRLMHVHAGTQSPGDVQGAVARVLNAPMNQVDVEVKYLGGAFGGKTTRTSYMSGAAALAAWKTNRPVRLAVERGVDTTIIGKRHPFLGEYRVAYGEDGTIHGLWSHFTSDGGNTYDCSFDVMDCALLGADNAYMIPNFRATGAVARTNKASNSAMRSYGMIQCVLIQEDAVERVAHEINRARPGGPRILPEDVRWKNMYQNGSEYTWDTTPWGQALQSCYMREVWQTLMETSDFRAREAGVQEFNAANRWRKRGISMVPLKYGLGYNLGWLEQGGAVVSVFASDGSVLVEHGGVEMGQGIMTKMVQIAARALDLPVERIQTDETNTNIVANPISTGATAGTDLNGGAVLDAATALRKRLQDFATDLRLQNGDTWCRENGVDYWNYPAGWRTTVKTNGAETTIWDNLVTQAYQNRVDLQCQALYQAPGLINSGQFQFVSFTYSAACAEVEIDVLTGEQTILRADVLYDAGRSLNPCLDVGQVEGAFVQGIGNMMTEELVYQPTGELAGKLNTDNTWGYKFPCSKSIPVDFRVSLYGERRLAASGVPVNPNLMLSSKGVGEPPLVVSSCVFFALKHAVAAARADRGETEWFELEAPATVQRIQQACLVSPGVLTL